MGGFGLHELSIASSILDTVRSETAGDGDRPLEVGVRVGEISGIDREALAFGFEALVDGSDLDGLKLHVEKIPHRRHCPACAREFEPVELDVACTACGEPKTEFLAGDELEIVYLEVEDS